MPNIRCRLGIHAWATTYRDEPRIVQKCQRCGATRSTTYDLAYGGTYWAQGDWWSKGVLEGEEEEAAS